MGLWFKSKRPGPKGKQDAIEMRDALRATKSLSHRIFSIRKLKGNVWAVFSRRRK